MDATLRAALQASLGDGYRIERELGGGGMSQVLLATDLTLDRQVVVKVLPPDLSAAASVERFRREIQLVARLQHPHVVPIVTAGDANGTLYYVMPFLAGESLRARMAREGPLKVTDTVRILREVLDALAFAHAHGVIHRDMKPENILLSASHAVVADFGVSKALQDSGAMTSVGMTVGTPSYMAPEQAAADPATDHRADLYAMGIVAYEMLSGAPPFTGTPSQVIAAHFSQAPAPLKTRRSDVPDALAGMIMRALAKDAAERPQSAEEMVAVLDAVLTPGSGETAATMRATAAGVGAAASAEAPAATSGGKAATGAAAVVTRNRRLAIGIGLSLAATVAAGAWFVLRPNVMGSAQSMAITPFAVADGDTALVRLSQNLVTTMSANLDGVGEIRVADPVAVLSHAKGSDGLLSREAAFALARKLGVRSAVVGTLARSGALVRADLAMYDVASPAKPLVQLSRSLPADSIVALTDSLTWGLLREVWAAFRAPTALASSIDTRNPAALRAFLDGEQWFARGGIIEATDAYRRAIAADTTFWFAHYRFDVARDWFGYAPDTTIRNRLQRHAAQLPERARLLVTSQQTARTLTQRAAQLADVARRFPDYPPALLAYGDYLVHHVPKVGGEVRDGIPYFARLVELMPADLTMAEHLALTCSAAGDRPCAERAFAHFDSLVRADRAPTELAQRNQREIGLAVLRADRAAVDSIARAALRDGIMPNPAMQAAGFGALLASRPDLYATQDQVVDLVRRDAEATPQVKAAARFVQVYSRFTRGDPGAVDSARALTADAPPAQRFTAERYTSIATLLYEVQGLREPAAATATEALRLARDPDLTRSQRVEQLWIAGANALWRGDSAMFAAQLGALAADTATLARGAARSLRALRMGRGGRAAAAAESLLVIERDHVDRRGDGPLFAMMAADRIVGADWLASAGRDAPADSLLRFSRAFAANTEHTLVADVTFGAAQLLRSRIAEQMGDKPRALEFARIFLASFDRAGPEGAGRIAEARDRITRLGGTLEGLPVTPVPKGAP